MSLKFDKMKLIIMLIAVVISSYLLTGCAKSGCDDCSYQKQQFCNAMSEYSCNGAALTDNIDQLTKACGSSDASDFISTTTKSCTAGNLTCPQCQ